MPPARAKAKTSKPTLDFPNMAVTLAKKKLLAEMRADRSG
jgi:hypothetical protein